MKGESHEIEDVLVLNPKPKPEKQIPWLKGTPSIEDTGFGKTLCFESWGGRLFYSDEGAVREQVEKFEEDYKTECRRSEEDPAGIYAEVTNFNDLYFLLGILPTPFGDTWGYNSHPKRSRNVHFKVELVKPTENIIADLLGCQVLIIEPEDDESYPDYYYREA